MINKVLYQIRFNKFDYAPLRFLFTCFVSRHALRLLETFFSEEHAAKAFFFSNENLINGHKSHNRPNMMDLVIKRAGDG